MYIYWTIHSLYTVHCTVYKYLVARCLHEWRDFPDQTQAPEIIPTTRHMNILRMNTWGVGKGELEEDEDILKTIDDED